jgi:hypothetical protein
MTTSPGLTCATAHAIERNGRLELPSLSSDAEVVWATNRLLALAEGTAIIKPNWIPSNNCIERRKEFI